MKKYLNVLIKAILAGICIGIGGTIYLSLEDKFLGSLLFAIGLFMIVTKEFNLYTGKVGYIFQKDLSYFLEVLMTLVGNFVGTFFVGFLLSFTRIYSNISLKATNLWNIKLNDNLLSIFILSCFCGMLMYLAVNGYKEYKDSLGKYLAVFLCVMVFILCGFEHSIANMFYLSLNSVITPESFGYLGIMVLGNACGGVFIPLLDSVSKKLK